MDDRTPSGVLHETYALVRDGLYEDALVRFLWFHRHAVAIEPSQYGVRLSFALMNWVKLGEKYPRARRALAAIRDGDAREIEAGGGSRETFHDVESINGYLDERHRTVDLFRAIRERRPGLARDCYTLAEEDLAAAGEFALCSGYLVDPAARLDAMIASRDRLRAFEAGHPPQFPRAADRLFAAEAARVVAILAGAGRRPEAERLRDRALAVLDAPEIRRAIEDAA